MGIKFCKKYLNPRMAFTSKNRTKIKKCVDQSNSRLKSLHEKNISLKQRLIDTESENLRLKNDNLTYLTAIKQKISKQKTDELNEGFCIDEDIDLETKNKVILLILSKCEELSERLKDELCHAIISKEKLQVSDNDLIFQNLRDILDKYIIHLELNNSLLAENSKLKIDNTALKTIVNNFSNLGEDRKFKKRKSIIYAPDQLLLCGISPTLVLEEFSFKKSLEISLKEQESLLIESENRVETLKTLIRTLSKKTTLIFDKMSLFRQKLILKSELMAKMKNDLFLLQQNNENLENVCFMKSNECEDLKKLVKEKDELIEDMCLEINGIKHECQLSIENKDIYINSLLKEIEDLQDKILVFNQIIENVKNCDSEDLECSNDLNM